jgi:hypothetical protein
MAGIEIITIVLLGNIILKDLITIKEEIINLVTVNVEITEIQEVGIPITTEIDPMETIILETHRVIRMEIEMIELKSPIIVPIIMVGGSKTEAADRRELNPIIIIIIVEEIHREMAEADPRE